MSTIVKRRLELLPEVLPRPERAAPDGRPDPRARILERLRQLEGTAHDDAPTTRREGISDR